jgi:hypothetical protein
MTSSTMPPPRPLNSIQRWLQRVITHPEGVAAGIVAPEALTLLNMEAVDLEQVILPSRQMSSLDRLQIYSHAYVARLLDCLKARYPAVLYAIGDDGFAGLGFGYLIAHPSPGYSLAALGNSFDAYLTATRPAQSDLNETGGFDFADFLIQLARLERIYSDVFDGPGPERSLPLRPADFAGLSPDDFAHCRLELNPSVRLLEFPFPVHEYASAIRQGIEPPLPIAREVCLVVTRRDYVVRRFEVTRQQFQLLSAIAQQLSIGEGLENLIANSTTDLRSLGADLQAWFHEWSAAQLFSKVFSSSGRGD